MDEGQSERWSRTGGHRWTGRKGWKPRRERASRGVLAEFGKSTLESHCRRAVQRDWAAGGQLCAGLSTELGGRGAWDRDRSDLVPWQRLEVPGQGGGTWVLSEVSLLGLWLLSLCGRLCPNPLCSEGHQSHWDGAHPSDLIHSLEVPVSRESPSEVLRLGLPILDPGGHS